MRRERIKHRGPTRKMKTRNKVLLIISIVVFVLTMVLVFGYAYISHLISLINYVPSSSELPESEMTSSVPMPTDSNVFNILLIGIDSRDTADDPVGRSDSMIVVSINTETKRIIMTSFMRDMYLKIPDHGSARLNAAYQYGGADLLVSTIEENFQLNIDNYATVDFFTFIDIIDKLGGVEITVTEKELPVLNKYVRDLNRLQHLALEDGVLPAAGENLLLSGKQALGYSRIRYVGNSDFERTLRQRRVLTQVIAKIKDQNIFALTEILNELLPDITTNLTPDKTKALLWNATGYLKYEVVQCRVPLDNAYEGVTINGAEVLSVDLEKNIAELQKQIYGLPVSDTSAESTAFQSSAASSALQ